MFMFNFPISKKALADSFRKVVSTKIGEGLIYIEQAEFVATDKTKHIYMLVLDLPMDVLIEINRKLMPAMVRINEAIAFAKYRASKNEQGIPFPGIKYHYTQDDPISETNTANHSFGFMVESSTENLKLAGFPFKLVIPKIAPKKFAAIAAEVPRPAVPRAEAPRPAVPLAEAPRKHVAFVKTNSKVILGVTVISNGEIIDLGDGLFMLKKATFLVIGEKSSLVSKDETTVYTVIVRAD